MPNNNCTVSFPVAIAQTAAFVCLPICQGINKLHVLWVQPGPAIFCISSEMRNSKYMVIDSEVCVSSAGFESENEKCA